MWSKSKEMKTIIGFTDSISECDCCGKKDLKGTFCIDLDGVELYYGSVCAFKNHGLTYDEQKELKSAFTKEQKNAKLIELYINPIKNEMKTRLENMFSVDYNELPDFAKKLYNQALNEYNRIINVTAKKYKISL